MGPSFGCKRCWILMTGLVPEDIFHIHPQIRWAGWASESGKVIFSKMRPGVETHSPEADDRQFLEFGGLIMDGVAQRSSEWLGKPGFVRVAYEKATQMVFGFDGGYLALTVEPGVSADEMVGIAKAVPGLASP